MKTFLLYLSCLVTTFCSGQSDSLIYPIAPHSDIRDTIWGVEVKDPYRPLETDNDARKEWLKEEEQITKGYFKKVHHASEMEYDFRHTNYSSMIPPTRSGPFYIDFRNTGLCIDVYYKDWLRDPGRLLCSPSMISGKVTRFSEVRVSPDGHYCALMYSDEGSDWQEIRVYNITNVTMMKDHIYHVRYSDITWFENGFFYNRTDSVDENKKHTDLQINQKLYYHKIGTDPAYDALSYEDKDNPYNTFKVKLTNDSRFLILTENFTDEDKEITLFKDMKENLGFKPLLSEIGSHTEIIGSKEDTLFAVSTNAGAYNGKIVEIDTKKPTQWGLIVDNQQQYLLKQVLYQNDTFYTILQNGYKEFMCTFSRDGDVIHTASFPTGSNNEFICYCPDQNSILLSQHFYICPSIAMVISLKDFSYKPYTDISRTYLNFNPFKYNFYLTNYRSKDSTLIPIYIVTQKDNFKKGPAPALLYVYGGFGISPQATFDPPLLTFLNSGGIYAVANIRGGANSAKDWHKSGAVLKKQNAIDDTYYAARFLIDSGFVLPEKLAIKGVSNGGLIVAAAINQHPEIFKAAILTVGLYDMIGYERYMTGLHWENEYGSMDDPIQFKNLLSYSPLQTVKENINYPSMLINTSEFDDRVSPINSYKYVAALQHSNHSKNPILLYVNKGAGHSYFTGSYEKNMELEKLYYAFLFTELGMKYKSYDFYKNK